jgi:hypothetical protein
MRNVNPIQKEVLTMCPTSKIRGQSSPITTILLVIGIMLAHTCIISAQNTSGENTGKPAPADAGASKTTPTDANPKSAPQATSATNTDLSSVYVKEVSGDLALFRAITVTVVNLPELLKAAGNDPSKIILYPDGYPLKGVPARAGNTSEELKFDLKRSDLEETKRSWNSLLGRPYLPIPKEKSVSVTVGLEGRPPVRTEVKDFPMTVINKYGYWIFIAALALVTVLFVRWARNSEVLRVGPRLEDGKLQRYSLGRCQMAYWFFIVAASYVFIWMVTSEYGVLPGSVLGLIGISAATALGAVLIDTSGPGSVAASATPQPTAGFFNDIFSDDQGKITFHRFQIFVWSIVLGIIFLASVYNVLTMPDFPGELLALMGISSGTYIGFKFPEKQEAQNRAAANVNPPNPPGPPNPPNQPQ